MAYADTDTAGGGDADRGGNSATARNNRNYGTGGERTPGRNGNAGPINTGAGSDAGNHGAGGEGGAVRAGSNANPYAENTDAEEKESEIAMNTEIMDKLIVLIAVFSGIIVGGMVWMLTGLMQRWTARRKARPKAAVVTTEEEAPKS